MTEQEEIKNKVLRLLIEDPTMISLVKSKYLTDDIWKFCIEREPSVFKYMIDPSVDMCFYALEQDGHNLKYIRNRFKNIKIDYRMAYIAISNCPKAIYYVPRNVLDEGLKELAIKKDPSFLMSFKLENEDTIRELLEENPTVIKYIDDPLKYEDVICRIMVDNPNIIVYCNTITDSMREVLSKYHPEYLSFIPAANS